MDLHIKILQLFMLSIALYGLTFADEIRCFVCSSYMEQCKEHVYTNQGFAHRGRCYSKCFVRLGEDKAIYRGCFDAFREVPYLTSDYNGCRNQTWNGQTRPWCFCDGDLCNKVSMGDLGYQGELDLSQGYRVNGYDDGVYPDEYDSAHYVDEMNKYDEVPSGNVVYQHGHSRSYDSDSQGYGYEEEKKKPKYETSHENSYAKEGYDEVKGYEIKDVNHADIDMKKLDKFMQDYYTDNGYQGVDYGQEYNRFNYYQVEDPNVYTEDTNKYISMDESEGIKMDESHVENELNEDKKKQEVPENTEENIEEGGFEEKQDVSKILVDEYKNTGDRLYKDGHNDQYRQQQTFSQSNQFYQPYVANQRRDYNNRRQTILKDEFKGVDKEGHTEEDPYYFPPHLAERIECKRTGFYQNPDDCRTFVACILDAHVKRPYMHLMRCPEGLVWDNTDKICNQYSTTCNVGGVIAEPYDVEETQEASKKLNKHEEKQQHQDDFMKYAEEK